VIFLLLLLAFKFYNAWIRLLASSIKHHRFQSGIPCAAENETFLTRRREEVIALPPSRLRVSLKRTRAEYIRLDSRRPSDLHVADGDACVAVSDTSPFLPDFLHGREHLVVDKGRVANGDRLQESVSNQYRRHNSPGNRKLWI